MRYRTVVLASVAVALVAVLVAGLRDRSSSPPRAAVSGTVGRKPLVAKVTTTVSAPRWSIFTTGPAPLREVEYHVRAYPDYHKQITITADGLIRREGSRARGEDGVATGRLSPKQMEDLAALFKGWDSVALPPNFGMHVDGPQSKLRYGENVVSFGFAREAPKPIPAVCARLDELAHELDNGE